MSKEEDLELSIKGFKKFIIKSITDWNKKYNTDFYCPNEDEIEFSFREGYYAMTKYGIDYGVNTIAKIDLIKLFSFGVVCFDIDLMKNLKGKVFTTQPLWYGILSMVPSVRKNCSFSIENLKDVVITCRILHQISYNRISPNGLAAYCYIKGVEETAVATSN